MTIETLRATGTKCIKRFSRSVFLRALLSDCVFQGHCVWPRKDDVATVHVLDRLIGHSGFEYRS